MARRHRTRVLVVTAVVSVAACVALAATLFHVLTGDAEAPSKQSWRSSHTITQAQLEAHTDAFGITNLQPSQPDGMQWTSNWDAHRDFEGVDPKDSWFDVDHGDASYQVSNGQLSISGEIPRMYVHDPQLKRQWRDVEVTMYFKRVNDDHVDYAGMTAIARSNHLDTQSGRRECDTRGVGARVRYDGRTDFEKETAFPSNEATGAKVLWPDEMPKDEWIGYKFLVYDKPDGVHLELWVDQTGGRKGGQWQKVNSVVDNGKLFGSEPCAPGIDPQMALTNAPSRKGSESGRPNATVYFRSDAVNRDGLVYKWGSVREIKPR